MVLAIHAMYCTPGLLDWAICKCSGYETQNMVQYRNMLRLQNDVPVHVPLAITSHQPRVGSQLLSLEGTKSWELNPCDHSIEATQY
jgi:hypothetical protein